MKKIILGLLLVFSVSLAGNLYTESKVFISGVKSIALIRFNLPPSETEKIIKNVLLPFEVNNGAEELVAVSMCYFLFDTERIQHLKECEIDTTIINSNTALENYNQEYQYAIMQVYTAAGYVIDIMGRYYRKTQPNGKKKRI